MRIVFAGVVEGEEICHGGSGEDPLELGGKDIAARRIGGQKAAPLEEEKTVRADLGPCERGVDLIPESPQALRVFGAELYKHSAVDQGLLIPAHGGDEGFHVLEVRLGVDAPAHVVGISPVHAVFVLGVVDDGVLFSGGGLADIDVEDHAAFFAEMAQKSQFFRGGGIAPQGQGAAEGAAQDIRIRVELHGGRGGHVQEVLDPRSGGLAGPAWFLLLLFSH